MKDDGARLTFAINGCKYNITDNLSGGYCIFDMHNPLISTIPKDVIMSHLQTLVEILSTVKVRYTSLFRKILEPSNNIRIVETTHYSYDITYGDFQMTLHNGVLTCPRGTDVTYILRQVNYVWSNIMTSRRSLSPKNNIVRRIADCNILVWVWQDKTIVCHAENVCGSIMLNCMINGEVYKQVFVSIDRERGTCDLFDSNLQLILEIPVDESILEYYAYDDDAFKGDV